MRIDWDDDKAKRNLAKHGISFNEAATVLMDIDALSGSDETHSEHEDRTRTIGLSFKFRILVVINTERQGDVVRIISARKANQYEQSQYEENARRRRRRR